MITDPKINDYLLALTPARQSIVAEMETYGYGRGFPLIGPLVGRVLWQYAKITNARRVFEMGSGYGYSAAWFALAMGSEGGVICTEGDAENRDRAADYHERPGIASQVDFRVADARDVARELLAANGAGTFDIVFNDVDKEQYPESFDLGWQLVRPGGLYLCDNTLWSGRVAEPVAAGDEATAGVIEHNRRAYAVPDGFATILPLRDGVAVVLKAS